MATEERTALEAWAERYTATPERPTSFTTMSGEPIQPLYTEQDLPAAEAQHIGVVSQVVEPDALLEHCYELAARISGFSRPGVELTKRMLAASLDAASLGAHMDHEGIAQLFVRLTTRNFEEAVAARREGRAPEFKD